jgi:hypothetical protein
MVVRSPYFKVIQNLNLPEGTIAVPKTSLCNLALENVIKLYPKLLKVVNS